MEHEKLYKEKHVKKMSIVKKSMHIFYSKHQLDLAFPSVTKINLVYTKTALWWILNEDWPEMTVYNTQVTIKYLKYILLFILTLFFDSSGKNTPETMVLRNTL